MNYEEVKKDAPQQIDEGTVKQNVSYFDRVMDKAYWIPEYVFEAGTPIGKRRIHFKISDSETEYVYDANIEKYVLVEYVKQYRYVTFVWGEVGKTSQSCVVSFLQKNKDYSQEKGFCYELTILLNKLGREGYLKHRTRNDDGSERTYPLHKRVIGMRKPIKEREENETFDAGDRLCDYVVWTDIPDKSKKSVFPEKDNWEKLFVR